MPVKKKSEPVPDMGPRILVILDPAADGARAVELACLMGRERHAVIHLAAVESEGAAADLRERVERATQQARLFHMRVVVEGDAIEGSSSAVVRLARRVRPATLVYARPRPGWGCRGLRRQLSLAPALRRIRCETGGVQR